DPCVEKLVDATLHDVTRALRPGDLLVVNDAAALPASLRAVGPRGEAMEIRLASFEGGTTFRVVLFGAGDWREKTEDRAAPPTLAPGDVLDLGDGLASTIRDLSSISPRLV